MSFLTLVDVAKRAEKGPIIRQDDFNMKIVSVNVQRVRKEFGIEYDPKDFHIIDDRLDKKMWEAGLQVFLETGLYSSNNRRRILFSEEEIKAKIKYQPSKLRVGQGKDECLIYSRGIEDKTPPIIFGGSFNTDVDESMFIKFNMAYAKEPIIDVLFNPGQLVNLDNVEIRLDSAVETASVIRRASLTRQALKASGRPGLPCVTQSGTFPTAASFSQDWGFQKHDIQTAPIITPLTVHDSMLSNFVYFSAYGIPLYTASVPLIGGFGGGPAGTAILSIAEHIGGMMMGVQIVHLGAQHVIYGQQSNNQSLWTAMAINRSIAKYTNLIHLNAVITAARPGQLQYFYETAAETINSVVSGAHPVGPRAAKIARHNQNTPLAARFMGEVAHAASKLDMKKASTIIQSIYELYSKTQKLDQIGEGKVFEELYDLENLIPLPEHQNQYNQAKETLMDLGLF